MQKILLLCADAVRHIGTVQDHIDAFDSLSRHDVFPVDAARASSSQLDLSMFDAVVFHYSIVISMDSYLSPSFVKRLSTFSGPKVLFIQDEFRWVNNTMAAAERLGISTLFTVVNEDVIRKIYRAPYFDNVRFEQTLTGFVPEQLNTFEVPAYENRKIDVSYRARKLPGWCGSFALQKWQIGTRFLEEAPQYELNCDIAMDEASRIYGDEWIQFVANSRATLGTESGASFVDFSGKVYQAIDAFETANPEATFETIRDRFLEGRDGEAVIHVISPRCFEAACLRTMMILYPGDYSNILKPWRHYVPLNRDHSNMKEVVSVLRDPARSAEIIDNAYQEIACSGRWTHTAFATHFDQVMDEIGQSSLDSVPREASDIRREIEKALRHEPELVTVADVIPATPTSRPGKIKWLRDHFYTAIESGYRIVDRLPHPISRPIKVVGRHGIRSLRAIAQRIRRGLQA